MMAELQETHAATERSGYLRWMEAWCLHSGPIKSWLSSRGVADHLADELVSEAFAIGIEHAPDLERSSLRYWLYATARRLASNQWRSRQRHSSYRLELALLSQPAPSTHAVVESRERLALLCRCVKATGDEVDLTVFLGAMAGREDSELLEALRESSPSTEVSASTLRQRRRRLRQKLSCMSEEELRLSASHQLLSSGEHK